MSISKLRHAAGILALSLYTSFLFAQVDTVPPTLVCLDSIQFNLFSGHFISVLASDVLASVSDDVSPTTEIELGLCLDICLYVQERDSCTGTMPMNPNGTTDTVVTFHCGHSFDFGAENYLKLWARDAAGNIATCRSRYFVYDNMGICSPPIPPAKHGGISVNTPNGRKAVEGVQVKLNSFSMNNNALSFSETDTTGQDGKFTIPKSYYDNDKVTYANIELMPRKNDDANNGVDTYDLLLLQKHLLGGQPITNPYTLIAADANRSGSITPSDIIELRKLILGIYPDSLPNNTSWRFVHRDFVFSDTLNPFLDDLSDTLRFVGNDFCFKPSFEAVKVGDLNFSAMYHSLQSLDDRRAPEFINLEQKTFKKGDIFDVRFSLENAAAAYQFTLEFEGLEVLDVFAEDGEKHPYFALFEEKNALSLLDEGKNAYFTIRFSAKQNGNTHTALWLSDAITKSLFFDEHGTSSRLELNGQNRPLEDLKTIKISPNPFRSRLVFDVPFSPTAPITTRISDAYGRVVFSEKMEMQKGKNQVFVQKQDMPAGMYFVELISAEDKVVFSVMHSAE